MSMYRTVRKASLGLAVVASLLVLQGPSQAQDQFKNLSYQHQINVWVEEIESLRADLVNLKAQHAKLLQRVQALERGEETPAKIRPRVASCLTDCIWAF